MGVDRGENLGAVGGVLNFHDLGKMGVSIFHDRLGKGVSNIHHRLGEGKRL